MSTMRNTAHDPATGRFVTSPPMPRFMAKVDQTGDCWLWTGAKTTNGYGAFDKRVAHRWLYERVVGPVPEGLQLDHLCRVRHCVNPAHLEPVTQRENLYRGNTIPALNAAKTHCPTGHPYDEANTYRTPAGYRQCRACARIFDRKRDRRRKAAA